jgi:hypothetical protein
LLISIISSFRFKVYYYSHIDERQERTLNASRASDVSECHERLTTLTEAVAFTLNVISCFLNFRFRPSRAMKMCCVPLGRSEVSEEGSVVGWDLACVYLRGRSLRKGGANHNATLALSCFHCFQQKRVPNLPSLSSSALSLPRRFPSRSSPVHPSLTRLLSKRLEMFG